jgi:predicted permease
VDQLLADLRYSFRVLWRNPGLAAVAVLSLALAIGPNAALFSVVDALGFRPLPVKEADTLLRVTTKVGGRTDELAYPEFREIRERSRLLTKVIVSGPQMFNVAGNGQLPEVVTGAVVSGDYLGQLGIRPRLGRSFLPEDDRAPGAAPVAMISERLWKRRFGGDPSVIGQPIRLTRQRCTIIGVVPAVFNGTTPILAPDVWIPAMAWPRFDTGVEATLEARTRRGLTVLARLAPGATLDQARAELDSLGTHLGEGLPEKQRPTFILEYEQEARRRPLAIAAVLASAIVGLVLLVACANVAGLLLGRAESRGREVAVRLAFGATRRRLVRQLLTESAVLAILAGVSGLVLAFGLLRLLPSLIPPTGFPLNFEFRLDLRIFLITLAVALSAVPFFGLVPALLASRPDLVPLLKGDTLPLRGGVRFPLRRVLVVSQIAVAVALLVGSAFLVQSFIRARGIDPGFKPRPMLITTLVPGAVGYSDPQAREYYRQVLERLAGVEGVERVSLVRHVPLNSLYGGGATMGIRVPGHEPAPGAEPPRLHFNSLAPGYFDTMGTPLVNGRDFDITDQPGGPGVAIVNETMARRYWPGRDPIGESFELLGQGDSAVRRRVTIVGVARDAKYLSLTEAPEPFLYLPLSQDHRGEISLIVRYAGDTGAMSNRLRSELLRIDEAIPILQMITLQEHLHLALAAERAVAATVGTVGALGLGLSLVGLYGVISFLVGRRTREIGVRMALGARPSRVVLEVLREGLRLTGIGVVLGLAASAVLMRVAAGAMYGVNPSDPWVFLGTGLAVLGVSLIASWVPARHAARVDPLVALRTE